jgi:hypothetical protein
MLGTSATTSRGTTCGSRRRVCDGSKSKAEARLIAAPIIAEINAADLAAKTAPLDPDRTIAEFWTAIYEPYMVKHKRANKPRNIRHSSVTSNPLESGINVPRRF